MINSVNNGTIEIINSSFNDFNNRILCGSNIDVEVINSSFLHFNSIIDDGGIMNVLGSNKIIIKYCIFNDCEISLCGGILNYMMGYESFIIPIISILNCNFSKCYSVMSCGGVISIQDSCLNTSSYSNNIMNIPPHFILFNCSFESCTAFLDGGVIFQNSSSVILIVESCVFVDCGVYNGCGGVFYLTYFGITDNTERIEEEGEENYSLNNCVFNESSLSYIMIKGCKEYPTMIFDCFADRRNDGWKKER
jgi:hypothetical protein